MARRSVAWLMWVVGAASVAYGMTVTEDGSWSIFQQVLGGLAFGVVGLVLATRTANVVGWLCLALQITFGLSLAGSSTPLMVVVAGVLLVFPSGKIPSPRWRFAVGALAVAGVAALADTLGLIDDTYSWLAFMGVVVPLMIASAVRIISDYRRAEGEIRRQLKWLAWVLIVGGAVLAISMIPLPYIDEAHDLAGVILLIGSPIAIGFAVTRYRLYEIDRIISRTVAYALVVGILALVVAILALGVGAQFDQPWVVAATTLGVAAAFNPLRRRLQGWVDKRFNRAKYDVERVADVFAASLRQEVDPTEVVDGWIGVVAETMQPRVIAVWTRVS